VKRPRSNDLKGHLLSLKVSILCHFINE